MDQVVPWSGLLGLIVPYYPKAGGGRPTLPPQSIEAVWVNGVLSFSQGRSTGERGGRFLRRGESFIADTFEI